MKRFATLIAAPLLLGGCGLPTLFTGVVESPSGRTTAGSGLATFTPATDPHLCGGANFQGALDVTQLSATCEVGADGSRKETFSVGRADPTQMLTQILANQTQQNQVGTQATADILKAIIPLIEQTAANAALPGSGALIKPPTVPMPPSTPAVTIDPTALPPKG